VELWFGPTVLEFVILAQVVKYRRHLLHQLHRCLEDPLELELISFFGLQLLFYRCILGSLSLVSSSSFLLLIHVHLSFLLEDRKALLLQNHRILNNLLHL